MASKMSVVQIVLTLGLIFTTQSQETGNVIKWVSGQGSNPIQVGILPAGHELHTLYSCRARVKNDISVGKLFYSNQCEYVYGGNHGSNGVYELLYAAPGTTSWVPFTGVVDENTVVGGIVDGKHRYVCRSVIRSHNQIWFQVIPGELEAEAGKCRFYHNHAREVTSDFEVLVRNSYGQIINTTMYQ